MKKFLFGIVFTSILVVGIPIAGSTLTTNQKEDPTNDLPQLFDRFNLLIKKEPSYVVTNSQEGTKQEPGGYQYYQSAVTESGKKVELTYYAAHELKENAILKLDTKGRYVNTWQEVTKDDVPQHILEQLEVN